MYTHNHTVKTTCKFCRREFDSFGFKKICNDCDSDLDKHFKLIKAYLNEFPGATVAEICEDLEIPSALVKYFLKEERLEIIRNSGNYFLKCNYCGKPIITGRFCFDCEIQVSRSSIKGFLAKSDEEEAQMESEIARFHSRRGFRTKGTRK